MRTYSGWWWIPCTALLAVFLKAALLTPWVAAKAEDASTAALEEEGLDAVEFVGIDGIDLLSGEGLNVILEGPPTDRSLAIAVVQARDEVERVVYRSVTPQGADS